jgi:glutamine amidotransferase-like uncharacterized protein
MEQQILIYLDEGVAQSYIIDLISFFSCLPYFILTVNAAHLLHEQWERTTKLLVIPGGRDLPYVAKLGLNFRERILSWLHHFQGSCFIGICAGAYFSSKQLAFTPCQVPNSQWDVFGDRLNLLPVMAVGPIFKNEFEYATDRGVRLLKLSGSVGSTAAPFYYNGGCTFDIMLPGLSSPEEDMDEFGLLYGNPFYIDTEIDRKNHGIEVEIVATFDSKPIMVARRIGQSKIFLSGVHFEVQPGSALVPERLRSQFEATVQQRVLFIREHLLKELFPSKS